MESGEKWPTGKTEVSDLNTPAYMQPYLDGIGGNDLVQVTPESTAKKAPLVSIEAIAGTIIDDPESHEIGLADNDDDFEEYRRRRKLKYGEGEEVDQWLKKSRRNKRIKICAIIITVTAVIVTGIALAIHFGASNIGSGGVPSSNQGSSNIPGFPIF